MNCDLSFCGVIQAAINVAFTPIGLRAAVSCSAERMSLPAKALIGRSVTFGTIATGGGAEALGRRGDLGEMGF